MNTKIVHKLIGHEDSVSCIDISNENILISGSFDSTIRVWV
jgi:WD40 repeat protein